MSNPHPYEDQTYGSGRNLDHQDGRLSEGLKSEPIFLRPTQAEFWILTLVSLGVTMFALTLVALFIGPDSRTLLLGGAGLALFAWAGSYLFEAWHRWRKTNYRYAHPGDLDH